MKNSTRKECLNWIVLYVNEHIQLNPSQSSYLKKGKALSVFIETLTDLLKHGHAYHIRNIGNLVPRYRKERVGRNPKTKDPYVISPRVGVYLNRVGGLEQCKENLGSAAKVDRESMVQYLLKKDEKGPLNEFLWLLVVDAFSDFVGMLKSSPGKFKLNHLGVFYSCYQRNPASESLNTVLVCRFKASKTLKQSLLTSTSMNVESK